MVPYGWSGEAPKQIAEALTDMKLELAADTLLLKYVPDDDMLTQCIAFGRQIAAKVKEKV